MYTSLKNQVLSILAGCDLSQCGYELKLVTSSKYVPDGELFQTPDAALQWIYDDAHKRGLPYLKIMAMLDFRFEKGNVTTEGKHTIRGFEACRSSLKMIIHEDVKNNMIWSADDTGTMGRDDRPECLAYPSEKPQYEMLDYIRAKDKNWCQSMCHCTVAEYEVERNKSSPSRDLEDLYTLIDGSRPPNSLPISKFSFDICKEFELDVFKGLNDNSDVQAMSDDMLMAVIKRGGGEIPRDVIEQA